MHNFLYEVKIWLELFLRFILVVLVGALALTFTLFTLMLGTIMWIFGFRVTVNNKRYRWFRKL